ncbi:GNAT family N-acetyltransferase [Mucilaginibacter sp. BJC16-A38]|uniref:arsenic resistance N-acetyltransferase ArsN2 n=1 Tax=Mucilaginibacter phenanthrenivorans TaxID=1234842 RepID=UPI0021583828|nr:arsenic resistance N-acetyltransferase ArsN2 [Mucilaginibacter phenanthrenivorans]MCR8558297.1 GNAT family N-acetyltransferase [Mucilaginibacter phenanthrenivorans]
MKTQQADNYREAVIALLAAEKLPTDDLPKTLENFVVTTQEEDLTGVIGLELYGDYALLRSLAVNKNYRNQGIAGKLLQQVEELATSKGIKAIYLLTETAPAYFSSKGYDTITRTDVPAKVQQSSEFSYVCPQSAIVMQKLLNQVL